MLGKQGSGREVSGSVTRSTWEGEHTHTMRHVAHSTELTGIQCFQCGKAVLSHPTEPQSVDLWVPHPF